MPFELSADAPDYVVSGDNLAVLPDLFIPFSGFAVTPVLGWWREPSPVAPVDPGEVAAVERVPIADLRAAGNRVVVTHPSGWLGPGYAVAGMLVWGFTAGLLTRLLELGGLLPAVELESLPRVDFPTVPNGSAGPTVSTGSAGPTVPTVSGA